MYKSYAFLFPILVNITAILSRSSLLYLWEDHQNKIAEKIKMLHHLKIKI